MSETLRILFVNDLYAPFVGGAPTHQLELAKRLVARGHLVRVVTSRIQGTEPSQVLDGVEIQRLNVGGAYERYMFALLSVPSITKDARSFDVIQTSTFVPAFPASVSARLAGKPSILTVYEVFGNLWSSLYPERRFLAMMFHAVEKAAFHLPFQRYIAVSDYTHQRVLKRGVPSEQCETVYPGIDYSFWTRSLAQPERFRTLHSLDGRFVYLSYGRAGISKGVEFLLDAAETVAKVVPDSRLLLVLNEGPMFERLVNRIRGSATLVNHVVLRSRMPPAELRDALGAADCVVVPSLSEGFGFALAEAGAMGRPVIATSVGSVPEVVSGKHILVPGRDSKALAEGILRGYEGGWRFAPEKQFSWDETVAKYEVNFRIAVEEWENSH